eukprot:s2528_g1.t2
MVLHSPWLFWACFLFLCAGEDSDTCDASSAAAELFGPPEQRDDEWIFWISRQREVDEPFRRAQEVLRAPATAQAVASAWNEVQHLGTEGGRCEEIEGLGRFVVRYLDLWPEMATSVKQIEVLLQRCGGTGLEAAALLRLAADGKSLPDAEKLLEKAANAGAPRAALRQAVALHGQARGSEGRQAAVKVLVNRAREELKKPAMEADSVLLATFGFLAASVGLEGATAKEALDKASQGQGRGAVEAVLYLASMSNHLPFELCQQLFRLERDILFRPSGCLPRLELAVRLLQASGKAKERKARERASRLLRLFAFDCPAVAEDLSGMGSAWLTSPDAASGQAGLAGDLFAVSAIRLGTRAANYAVWSASNASARAAMSRSQHSEVLHAAKVAKSLSPRQCKKKAFDRPSLLSPGKSHPWGCPEVMETMAVAPRDFATRCLRSRRDSL